MGQLRVSALGFAVILLPAPGGQLAQIEGARLCSQLRLGEVPLLWLRAGLLRYRTRLLRYRTVFGANARARSRMLRENGLSGYAAAVWNHDAKGFEARCAGGCFVPRAERA
jgi:hypothetical protein